MELSEEGDGDKGTVLLSLLSLLYCILEKIIFAKVL